MGHVRCLPLRLHTPCPPSTITPFLTFLFFPLRFPLLRWLQLYKPLEFLFLVAAFTTLAENFLPQLMSLPKSIVQTVGGSGSW